MSTANQDAKILTVASCSFVRDEHRSHVVVSGSYGGRYNAFNAAKWGGRGSSNAPLTLPAFNCSRAAGSSNEPRLAQSQPIRESIRLIRESYAAHDIPHPPPTSGARCCQRSDRENARC
jgi:hypothetical protein